MASKDFGSMEDSNRSANPSIHDVSDPGRRTVLRGTLGVAVSALYAPLVTGCAAPARALRDAPPALAPSVGFKGIAVDASDKLIVPEVANVPDGEVELFDLRQDPRELVNQYDNAEYVSFRSTMSRDLEQWRKKYT